MSIYPTVGGIVARCNAGRVTIRLTNGATVTGDNNGRLEIGDDVIVGINRRSGEIANIWIQGTYLHDPNEQPLPDDEIFEED